jgi:coiled-coil domain-containing protein 6
LCRYAWEAEEENIVNRLQTQMLELYQRNKFLERRLEAGGCTS